VMDLELQAGALGRSLIPFMFLEYFLAPRTWHHQVSISSSNRRTRNSGLSTCR
jgi:hypothetical protein